jgi:sterol desaturase/sphingolipid hydroxylase (fatty acid hydroxylase superfamily)
MMLPLWGIPLIAVTVWVLWLLERRYPAYTLPVADVLMDWKLVIIRLGMNQLITPVIGAVAIVVINAMGAGFIHLRVDGWWFLLSLVAVVLITDFAAYAIHVANHKIPMLWAMHSLHHSAEALSIITGARHFWALDVVNTIPFLALAIVFKVPPEIVTWAALLHLLPCGLSHMNVRFSLGRFALVVNNPQYHRIHHSVERQHHEKNFCQIFPLFDVIFGTAWKPAKDEFPAAGLVPRDPATGFMDGLIWPVRNLRWVRGVAG